MQQNHFKHIIKFFPVTFSHFYLRSGSNEYFELIQLNQIIPLFLAINRFNNHE